MKRFLSLLMTAMLILGMATAVTAANAAPKAYASAKDGELLYHLNFNDTAVFNPKGNDAAEKYYTYSVGDNGSSLTIRGTNKDVDGTLNRHAGRVPGAHDSTSYYCFTFDHAYFMRVLPTFAADRLRLIMSGKASFTPCIDASDPAGDAIREIIRKLPEGSDAYAESAMCVGFADYTSFCRAFQKVMHTTPTKYFKR